MRRKRRHSHDSKPTLPTSRAKRTLKSAGIAARLASGIVGEQIGNRLGRRPDPDMTRVSRGANAILASMGEMKGLVMKVGQMLSYIDVKLAPELTQVLSALQDSAPPMSPGIAEEVLTQEFGARPAEIFSEWDARPFAAASIGQVHRARMHDGTEVAVKVQYPEIVDALESDLRNIALIQMLGSFLARGQDVGAIVAELRERFLEECDYLLEAENQSAFRSIYQGHPYVMIPEVLRDYCTRRVLITKMVHGRRFKEFVRRASQAERDHAGTIIWEFVFASIFHHAIFNCDPHPGNYLFLPDGLVAFLDFGCVKRFPTPLIENWRESVKSLLENDSARFAEVTEKTGYVGNRARFDFAHNWRTSVYLNRPILYDRPFRYTREYVRETTSYMVTDNRNASSFNMPKDTVFINRLRWGLWSVLAELRAEANWRRLLLPLLYDEGEPVPPPFPDNPEC